MSNTAPAYEPSGRLKHFLLGVRAVGLLVALFLVDLHRTTSHEFLRDYSGWITAAILSYHSLAGLLSLKNSKMVALLILALDMVVGVGMTLYFGNAYLVLAFTLPVLEVACSLGNTAAMVTAIIGGIFYVAFSAFPILDDIRSSTHLTPLLWAKLHVALVMGALSLCLFWLYGIAVREGQLRVEAESKGKKEKELLFQELQSKAGEVGQIIGEVGDREARIMELEQAIKDANEEREAIYRDLHKAKMTSSRLESMMDETQKRMSDELKREKQSLEREAVRIKKKLDRQLRLMDIMKEVVGNLSLNDTLLAMTAQLQSLFSCQSCVIFLIDEVDGHRELFPEVAASKNTEFFRNLVLQIGEEAPGWVAQYRQSLKIDNRAVMAGEVEVKTLIETEGSALVAPLVTTKDVLGAVYLGRNGVDPFSPDELELLDEFCILSSLALANSLEYSNTINRGLHDPLTRLYNALYLQERMREEVMRGRRYTYPVALLLLDIDGFNELTSQFGEDAAESILREIAEVIQNATRETDVSARLEGDDFGVLLVHSDRSNALMIAERIRGALEKRSFGSGRNKVRLTASIGVAGVPHDATNEEQLKVRASAALQQARTMGGNSCAFWDTTAPTRA
ncbi:MAG: diguanylate cyclase [Armatimonadetes bacterium]|nr:diguanylate cyclase [Armatimonadota bacterium]